MRAIGYVRVSTEEQSREGVSLQMQIDKIKAYCVSYDLELAAIYGDPGISAKTIEKRPGLRAVLSMVDNQRIDGVVAYKLDRLCRNTIDALELARQLDKKGVALHSITEKLDTQSALGRFFFTLTASLAEMERGLISERTKAALAQKRMNGQKTGGDVPYGFTADENGKLICNEREQRIVSRINALKADGYSIRRIVTALEVEGFRTRKGTPFSKTQVERILAA